jgi:hypothetical protein
MPFYLLIVAANIALLVHAAKTGRFNPWGFIILALPGVGGAVYFLFELAPQFLRGPKGRKLRAKVGASLSGERAYHVLREDVALTGAVASRESLAAECLASERFDEALVHYRVLKAATPFGKPQYWIGAARALEGLGKPAAALDDLAALKQRWPHYHSADDHLLYARLLEAVGRLDAALEEYDSLAGYHPGAEPRARRANLLLRLGRAQAAREAAELVLIALRASPGHVRRAQSQWIDLAQTVIAATSI